jgi:thermostable 8-oxoguanine DNA glycosylase
MIDPTKITNYNLNKYQLEEMILFWVLVAGKNARTTVRMLDNLFTALHKQCSIKDLQPFDLFRNYSGSLEELLKSVGFGCQKTKAKAIRDLVSGDLDLKTCTIEQLEKIHGIGPKTARCFVMHTREGSRHAGIDTHILKWLKSLGYKTPTSTPTGKSYYRLECIFLAIADLMEMSPADLDLAVWNAYSQGREFIHDSISRLPKEGILCQQLA